MSTTYPTTLQDLDATRGTANQTLSSPSHVTHHNNEDDTIEALQAKVGVDSSAVATTLDYIAKNASSNGGGHVQTPTTGGTGLTTYAKGDIVIGSGTNTVAKLTVGSNNTLLVADSTQSTGVKWGSATTSTIQTFTASGTWTKPTGLAYAVIELVGGGGGGGGANSAGNTAQAGGGGGGGYSRKIVAAGTLGSTETVTIGAAGTAGGGGAPSTAGGTGGTTSFGAHCSATGGAGGQPGTSATVTAAQGGQGGAGSSGTMNSNGNSGAAGSCGGGSFFGGGGPASGSTNGNGSNGQDYGGGGGGASASSGSGTKDGGAGAKGFIIVTEHYI